MRKLFAGLAGLGLSCGAFAATPSDALRDYSPTASGQERAVSFGSHVDDVVLKERSFDGNGAPSINLGGPPSNDECVNAINVPCDSTFQIDNSAATTAMDDPDLSCYAGACPGPGQCQGAGSVWYTFQAASNGIATVDSCPELPGGGVDTVIAIYDGTCGNLTEVACNEDGPAAECPIFNAIVQATGLTPGNTYIIEIVSFTPSDVGLYEIELICEPTGACCIDDTCMDDMTSAACFDAGGVWQGTDTLCADITAAGYCVAPPMCPMGGIIDNDGVSCGQPSPDNNNAGCASPSGAFQFLPGDGCASVVCGQSSADDRNGSNRDTDWYFFTPVETTEYTACVTAQFFPQVQFWPLNPGIDPCLGVVPGDGATGNPGEMVCVTSCLLGNNPVAVRVTTVDVNGDPQRNGIGCNDYVLEMTCDQCVLGACCGTDNVCVENQTEADCVSAGGEYQGDNSDCVGVTCGGSCCLEDGMCMDGVSRVACLAMPGAYNGQGTLCVDQSCPVCVFEDPMDLDGLEGPNEDCSILGVDLVNSGCTSGASGNDFSVMDCNDTLCGITAFDGGTRDLDWIHITVPTETEALIEVDNQMAPGNPILFRFQWRDTQVGLPACGGGFNVLPTALVNSLPPGQSFFSVVLTPARYTALVAYDFANNTALPPACPDGGRYRLTITCNDPCTFTCTDTEGEPDCGDVNEINDGCSADPAPGPFSPLSLNSKVCGSTRLIQIDDGMGGVTATRDVDWWMVNVPADGDYTLNLEAEFESLVIIQPLDGPGGCDDPAVASFQIFQCEAASIVLEGLTAGNYGIFVSADFNSYTWYLDPPAEEVCGAPYSLELAGDGGCAGVCADSNCDGVVTVSDIGFFVTAVANGEAAWNASFPGGTAPCPFCVNDTNGDGFVTVSDIGPFVNAVTGGGCQ